MKSGRGRTERVHPRLQALALLKDHQGPLSLAETVRWLVGRRFRPSTNPTTFSSPSFS